MKISAEEFARLTELLGKGSALTDEEKTEKAAIEGRIVATEEETDPADDSDADDTSDKSDATDEPETPPGDDIDAKAFERLSIGAKIKALITSRAGLIAKLGAATAQIKTLGTQLSAAVTRAETAEAALAETQTKLAEATGKIATLEAAAKDLNAAVTDELAGLGVDRKELVAGDAEGKGGAVEAAYDEFRNAKTPEAKAAAHKRLKEAQAKAKPAKTGAAALN